MRANLNVLGFKRNASKFYEATAKVIAGVQHLTFNRVRDRLVPTGYWVAGYLAGTFHTSAEKMDFATEVTARLASQLSGPRLNQAGCLTNRQVAGYVAGGVTSWTPTSLSSIEKLTFVGESFSVIASTLTASASGDGGASSTTCGYVIGRGSYNVGPLSTNIDRMVFSTENVALISAQLSYSGQRIAGNTTLQSDLAGYTAARNRPVPYTINKLTFQTEQSSLLGSSLSTSSTGHRMGVASPSRGYWCGGWNSFRDVHRIEFANESTSFLGQALANSRNSATGIGTQSTGYYAGMTDHTGSTPWEILRLHFEIETFSTSSQQLKDRRAGAGSLKNI